MDLMQNMLETVVELIVIYEALDMWCRPENINIDRGEFVYLFEFVIYNQT